jgi:hypothetical protein
MMTVAPPLFLRFKSSIARACVCVCLLSATRMSISKSPHPSTAKCGRGGANQLITIN